jgi:hypothetical protein
VEAMALTETATVTWQDAAASMNRLQRMAFDLAISMVTANSGLGDAMLIPNAWRTRHRKKLCDQCN